MRQRLGRLKSQPRRRPGRREPSARCRARRAPPGGRDRFAFQLLDQRGQGPPLDELHGIIVDPPVATDRVDGHDPRVVEQGGGLRLDPKSRQMVRVEGRGERQDLQGHPPAQGNLHRFVNHPHPSPADLADDPEVAEHADPGGGVGGGGGGGRVVGGRAEFPQQGQRGEQLPQRSGARGMVFQEAVDRGEVALAMAIGQLGDEVVEQAGWDGRATGRRGHVNRPPIRIRGRPGAVPGPGGDDS